MMILDRQTARVLTTILCFAVGVGILYTARDVIVVFIFAILLAYLINPVVRWLQRHSLFFKNLRGPHILEAYLAFLVVMVLLLYGLAPGLGGQAAHFAKRMPAIVDGLTTGEIASELGGKYGWSDDQQRRVRSFLTQHRANIESFVANVERVAPSVLGSFVLVPVLSIFFLSDGEKLAQSVIGILSRGGPREALQSFAEELNSMLQHYIRAKVILGSLSLLFCSLCLVALGFPHAVALGILAGILEFIPILGWMLSATTILSVGALTHSHWIWMAALLGIWRLCMDYFVSPRVFGRELEIHPLLAIFTMMVGGAVGGVVGIYLSIPAMGVLHLAWNRFGARISDAAPRGADRDSSLPADVLSRSEAVD